MALEPLASLDDLLIRGVEFDDPFLAETMLDVASSTVRQAAGSSISLTTGTVTLWVTDDDPWVELPRLTTAVSGVVVDGEPVTDFTFAGHRLFRASGWRHRHYTYASDRGAPSRVDVTLTQGLPTVPAHIVQLVCDLAILGLRVAAEGGHDPRVMVESVDDYRVVFNQGDPGSLLSSAMELPMATRKYLAAQFGNSTAVVKFG